MTMKARCGDRSRLTPSATILSASISRPESVSSSTQSLGSSSAICRISFRFFSPPAKPTFTPRRSMSRSILFRAESSSNTSLEADRDQFLRLDGELHRQVLQHVLHESIDDERHGFLRREPALHAVEQRILGDLRGCRLVLENRGGILRLDI